MAALALRQKPEVELKSTGLSNRGAELSTSGATLDMFQQILGNPYHPTTNTQGIVNIGTAENYIMLQEAADFVNMHIDELKPSAKDFSYGEGPWGTPRLREAMAKHINRLFHPLKPVEANRLLFANGVTSLCEMLGFSICDEGDAILMSKPIYQAFQSDFGAKAKVKCVYTSFHRTDQFTIDAVTKYEDAIKAAEREGTRIRALVICHPHNPLGRCYTTATLIGLMQLCNKYKIHLLADEIYALSVYEIDDPKAVKFQSILTLDVERYIDSNYFHLLYGMSKDIAAGGLRLGCIYTHNEALTRAMSVISPFHWSSSSNERIATLMLEHEEWLDGFLALSRERLAASSKLARKLLDEQGVEYYQGSNAGLFLWIKLFPQFSQEEFAKDDYKSGWSAESVLTGKLIANGVYLTSGQEMNAEEPGWYRLIFSQDEKIVMEGIRRMLGVVKNYSTSAHA